MKSENKRIFISDLPETYTKELLESSFSKYGQVSSVEIKERKELGVNNKSLFFAYVNLTTDDTRLNQCFRDLSNTEWHGQYVQLQIARESFLERLKRERQETEGKRKHDTESETSAKHVENKNVKFGLKHQGRISKKYNSSSETKTINSENETGNSLERLVAIKTKDDSGNEAANTEDEKLDIVIKSNKNRVNNKGAFKIPSVGKTPIHEISKKTKVKNNNLTDANLKRLESLHKMKKSYETQKSVIKNALSYSSNKPNNKIIFGDGNCSVGEESNKNIGVNGFTKKNLFSEDNPDEDSDMELNFDIKRQFEGKSGQKLLELQSKYKNDKRFTLDERFIDDQNEDNDVDRKSFASDDNLEAEKNEQLKILEEILGKKVSTTTKDSVKKKTMLKFDPSQPEHSSFELPLSEPDKKKKKKEKSREQEPEDSKKSEPEVSKEVFYKVPEKLKETFAEKQQFSLLSMFGRKDEIEDKQQNEAVKELKRNTLVGDKNPFKYDSSDEEDEIMDIPHKDISNNTSKSKNLEHSQARANQLVFWTEPFFFKHDDFRLREGLDFIEKIKTEDKEFGKIRRELKGIVKAKVRNSERKNKMFKKKLGGNKRRRHIRIKKALKR